MSSVCFEAEELMIVVFWSRLGVVCQAMGYAAVHAWSSSPKLVPFLTEFPAHLKE